MDGDELLLLFCILANVFGIVMWWKEVVGALVGRNAESVIDIGI